MEHRTVYAILKQADDILESIENKGDKKATLLNMLLFRKATFEHKDIQYQSPEHGKSSAQFEIRSAASSSEAMSSQNTNWLNASNVKGYTCSVLRVLAQEIPIVRELLWIDPHEIPMHEQELLKLHHLFRRLPVSDQAINRSDFIVAFETIMQLHATDTSSKSGAFSTPKSIVDLMVTLLDPKGGSIYDPCCKNAATLLAVGRHLSEKNIEHKLFGQEHDLESWRIAKLLMYFSSTKADLGRTADDVFMNDLHPHLQADVVLGSPPFSSRKWYRDNEPIKQDPRWKYDVPPKSSGDFAWLQHMLYHAKDDGKLAIVLAVSTLYKNSASEHTIRKRMIEDDIIEAIITLPKGVFHSTQVATAIWILNKKKNISCQNCILFIDASGLGTKASRIVTLETSDCEKITSNYQMYIDGVMVKEEGFCNVVSIEEIVASEYTLFPKQYISYIKSTVPSILELESQSRGLQSELCDLVFANSALLDGLFEEK